MSKVKEAMAARQRVRASKPTQPTKSTPNTAPPPTALNGKNFPVLKQTSAKKLQATSAWVRSTQPPSTPQTNITPTDSSIGGIAETFALLKEFAPLIKEITEILKSINIKETLQTVKELLQTVSGMFGNGK